MAAPSPLRRGLALVGLVLLAGCGQSFRPSAPTGAPLRIVTTVLPVGLFTQAVAGSCAQVEALLPASADLHDLPVSPQLVGRLRGADVLVFNGLGLEAPLEQLLAGADGPRPRTIVAAAGLDPLPATAHDHDHDHDSGHGHAATHGHGATHGQEKGANAARSAGTPQSPGRSSRSTIWLPISPSATACAPSPSSTSPRKVPQWPICGGWSANSGANACGACWWTPRTSGPPSRPWRTTSIWCCCPSIRSSGPTRCRLGGPPTTSRPCAATVLLWWRACDPRERIRRTSARLA